MANTGLGSQLGVKKETTWGTAVVPDTFFEFESESLTLDPTYYDGLGLAAGRTFAPQSRAKKTTRAAAGDTAITLPYKKAGFFFDQMVAGTITPVQQGATAAWLSTFNVGSSVPTKSATLQVNKPASSTGDVPFTYPGGVLTSAAFSVEIGGALTSTFSWVVKDETTPTTTPAGASLATATYVSGNDVWVHPDITLTYGGSAIGGITGVNWTWTQPMKADRFFLDGSGTIAKPVPNGLATVTGTLVGEFYDNTAYAAFRSGAFASLVVQAAGPTAIASTFFPTFKNTFSAIQVRGSSPTVSGPDILDLSIPFVAKDDGTNPPWKIEYTSTDTAAW
jgi:hypothetical protein